MRRARSPLPNPKTPWGTGDIMSSEARSRTMSRIRGTNTKPERQAFTALEHRGIEYETHARDLPGRPDVMFRSARIAVFIDGDFWHSWRSPQWRHKLSEAWAAKIKATRRRDARNQRRLRRVARISERKLERDEMAAVGRIIRAFNENQWD